MKHPLDSQAACRYKAGLVFAVALLMWTGQAEAKDLVVKGAILPTGSRQVGEDRYKSSLNYAETLEYYKKVYKENPRKTIVNQPGIRAVHIVNDSGGEWEGLNIYELDSETRIYVVSRPSQPDGKKKGKSKGSK